MTHRVSKGQDTVFSARVRGGGQRLGSRGPRSLRLVGLAVGVIISNDVLAVDPFLAAGLGAVFPPVLLHALEGRTTLNPNP